MPENDLTEMLVAELMDELDDLDAIVRLADPLWSPFEDA